MQRPAFDVGADFISVDVAGLSQRTRDANPKPCKRAFSFQFSAIGHHGRGWELRDSQATLNQFATDPVGAVSDYWVLLHSHMISGKRLSPRSSLSLVLPILAGIPRNAPMRLTPENSTARHACAAPVLRCYSGSGRSVHSETAWLLRSLPLLAIRRPSATIRQDRSLRRLRSRHQRPCRASTVADSSLRSRPLAFTPLRTCATHTSARTGIGVRPGFASRLIRFAQTPLGLRCSLSLRRSRDLLPAEPHPAGLPHCSTCAGGRPGGASAFVRPRLKVLLAPLRSTLRDGADRRHPSGAADLTVRLGLGSA